MSKVIPFPRPWCASQKAVADFTEVCRQTGLIEFLREDITEPTVDDIERLAQLIGQTDPNAEKFRGLPPIK